MSGTPIGFIKKSLGLRGPQKPGVMITAMNAKNAPKKVKVATNNKKFHG